MIVCEPREALCVHFGCDQKDVIERAPGVYMIDGVVFLMTGNGLPSGLPSYPTLSKVGERNGYQIYAYQV